MSNEDAWLAHHRRTATYPSSQQADDDDESMDFQSVKYARKITAPPPEVNKSAPDPDMPKPDMTDGSYSTKQGNLLIIYKQKQEGVDATREEE
jgi:hypothetical protein